MSKVWGLLILAGEKIPDRMHIQPIYTRIQKQLALGDEYLVLEDHYRFNGRSNLYLANGNFVAWFAELPSPDDLCVGFEYKYDRLLAFTEKGLCVRLSPTNGKVLENVKER